VPQEVVERAEVVSQDFAKKFKEKMAYKREKMSSLRLPLVAQADFAYLCHLATGAVKLPEDPVRRGEVLMRMKQIVRRYIPTEKL